MDSYSLYSLVGGMGQIRHPSITFWHPYKTTHTTHKSVLNALRGGGPDHGIIACSHTRKGWYQKLLMWESPSDTLTRLLTLQTSQHWSLSQIWGCRPDHGLIACSYTRKGWHPKLFLWESCLGHGSDQSTIHHPLTPLQDYSHNTQVSDDHSQRSEVVGQIKTS